MTEIPHLPTTRGLRRLSAGGFMSSDVMHIQSAIEPEQRSTNHEPALVRNPAGDKTEARKVASRWGFKRHARLNPSRPHGEVAVLLTSTCQPLAWPRELAVMKSAWVGPFSPRKWARFRRGLPTSREGSFAFWGEQQPPPPQGAMIVLDNVERPRRGFIPPGAQN